LIPPAAVRTALFTAFVTFTAGVAVHYFLVKRHLRKLDAGAEQLWRGTWNYSFDDRGIRYKNEVLDVRVAWRAIDTVQDLCSFLSVRFGRAVLVIPSRVFTDDAARFAFLSAASTRIKAAAETAQA
jgi:hypothetical protein